MRVILHSKSQIVADIPGFVREGVDPDNSHSHLIGGPIYADADLTAEEAGRLCYLSGHRPNLKTATNDNYLLNICAQKHYSVLGHSSASFYIDEITRNCTHEIIRHRWFTFSEVSQRYVDAEKFWFASHPGIREYVKTQGPEDIQDHMLESLKLYRAIVEYLEHLGHTRKEARQAARHVLPGGTETKIMMSGNLRAWRDFLAQRLSPHADAEIRAVALEIYKILKGEFPNSFQDFDSKGMITTERLIQRALDRYDVYEYAAHKDKKWIPPKAMYDFAQSVREILAKGLWILKEDPWEDS